MNRLEGRSAGGAGRSIICKGGASSTRFGVRPLRLSRAAARTRTEKARRGPEHSFRNTIPEMTDRPTPTAGGPFDRPAVTEGDAARLLERLAVLQKRLAGREGGRIFAGVKRTGGRPSGPTLTR